MAEPLFGTAPPIWSAVPFPGPAWFQTPVAGGRPIAEGIVSPQGFAAGLHGAIIGPQGQGALGNGMVAGGVPTIASFSPAGPLVGRQDMAGRGNGNCAGDGPRVEARAAGRADERSGNRGLPLRRARSPAWIERRGGSVRRRPDDADGHCVPEGPEAGHRRNCLGDSRGQGRAEQHHDRSEAAVACAEP